jgi:hypothetical protein
MLERRLSFLFMEFRRMKYFCAWLATCAATKVGSHHTAWAHAYTSAHGWPPAQQRQPKLAHITLLGHMPAACQDPGIYSGSSFIAKILRCSSKAEAAGHDSMLCCKCSLGTTARVTICCAGAPAWACAT